jgi:hypothetical protein
MFAPDSLCHKEKFNEIGYVFTEHILIGRHLHYYKYLLSKDHILYPTSCLCLSE